MRVLHQWKMAEGWLTDQNHFWSARFHSDSRSWHRDPYTFVDYGRQMPNGEPALLKSRQRIQREAAVELWRSLVRSGWKKTEPLWDEVVLTSFDF